MAATCEGRLTTPKKSGGKLPFGHYSFSAGYAANKDPRTGGSNGNGINTAIDTPDRHELFLLGENEKKVELETETRKSSISNPPNDIRTPH